MSESWILIVNPIAGRGRGCRLARRAAALLDRAGYQVELCFTAHRGQAAELAHQAVQAGAARLIICGGDGTIREILPALAGQSTALGLLPSGTANDLARALGIPRRFRAAMQLLLQGRPCALDLGQAGRELFCTVAAFGFDAAVNQAVNARQVPFSGTLGYLWATAKEIRTYPFPETRLRGEFGQFEGRVLLVATSNTASYGGGLKIAPQADPRDGRFDVCIVRPVSAATVAWVLPRLFWGGHRHHPAVRFERTSWLEIETERPERLYADGDYLGETPIALRVLPAALRVVLP